MNSTQLQTLLKNITDGKNNDSVCRNSSRSIGAPRLGQGLEGRRDGHGGRIDEREEENICTLLLIGIQFWAPVGIAAKACKVIGEKKVKSQYLKIVVFA
jgi:hypothetical protein